jgi:hypothetical protein
MKKDKRLNQTQREITYNDNLIFYTLLLTILIVPLALRFSPVNFMSPILVDDNILGSGIKVNIFTQIKFTWLMVFTVITLLLLIFRTTITSLNFQPKWLYISLGSVILGLILSLLLSPFKTIALIGDYMRFEGTLTYLAYTILFFAALQINLDAKKLRWAGYALYPFVIINTVLITLNFYGINVIKSAGVQKILGLTENIKISETSQLLGSLDNMNYFSGVSAVLIGLYLTWALFDNNWKRIALNILVSICSAAILFSSTSTSGFITLIIVLGIQIILIVKSPRYWWSLATLLVFLIATCLLFIMMNDVNVKVWENTFGFIGIERESTLKLTIMFTAGIMLITLTSLTLRMVSKLSFKLKIFVTVFIFLLALVTLALLIAESVTSDRGNLMSYNRSETLNETKIANSVSEHIPKLPDAGWSAGTGRIYIWEKAVEMIVQKPLVGYGMDVFAYKFNQDDPKKNSNLNDYGVIVDKPHNLYLGVSVGGGILTLIGLLGLIIYSMFSSIARILSNVGIEGENVIFISIFIGMSAYFVQGLFNDSIIGVSSFVWILFGMLTSNNNKYRNQQFPKG